MIKKMILITLLLTIAGTSWAGQIVVIRSSNLEPYVLAEKSFELRLDTRLEKYNLKGSKATGEKVLAALNPKNVDLLVLIGITAVRAAQKHSMPKVPVLYTMVLKPQVIKGYKSTTGLIMEIDMETQFKSIRHLLPNAKVVGVFYNPKNSATLVAQARIAAAKSEFELHPIAVNNAVELKTKLMSHALGQIDCLWSIGDITVVQPSVFRAIIGFTLMNQIPLFALSESYVKAGALAAFSMSATDIGKQAAELTPAILAKDQTAYQPIVYPRMVVTYLNRKTQKTIGIKELSISNTRLVQ